MFLSEIQSLHMPNGPPQVWLEMQISPSRRVNSDQTCEVRQIWVRFPGQPLFSLVTMGEYSSFKSFQFPNT